MNDGDRERPGNAAWILVMDDEVAVRTAIRAMLERAGYRVYLTQDCDEAVECFREAHHYGYPFDAVILDLNMWGIMLGRDTVARMGAIDPRVRAIAMSGYLDDPAMSDYRAHGFTGVLAKPFTHDELEQAVRRVLGAPRVQPQIDRS